MTKLSTEYKTRLVRPGQLWKKTELLRTVYLVTRRLYSSTGSYAGWWEVDFWCTDTKVPGTKILRRFNGIMMPRDIIDCYQPVIGRIPKVLENEIGIRRADKLSLLINCGIVLDK